MLPPCSFGCEYRWNVASSWFGSKYQLRAASFLFQKLCFAGIDLMSLPHNFLNLVCGYQLECCVSTIFFLNLKFWLWISTRLLCLHDFWNFASIDEVSFPCRFEILEVSNGGLHPFDFWVLQVSTKCHFPSVFLKNHFFFKHTRVINFDSKPFLGVKARAD